MLRPAVSVVLALALVGIGTAALSATEAQRASTAIDGDVDRLERAAAELAATSTATRSLDCAGRVPVTVTVPDGSLATARVDRLTLGCPIGRAEADCSRWQARYRLPGGEVRRIAVEGPRLRTLDDPLVLGPGEHRLVLAHVRLRGGDASAGDRGADADRFGPSDVARSGSGDAVVVVLASSD
ncbi:MAG: hypothetical protein V5A46_01420 [Haloferacaceae archaeon]